MDAPSFNQASAGENVMSMGEVMYGARRIHEAEAKVRGSMDEECDNIYRLTCFVVSRVLTDWQTALLYVRAYPYAAHVMVSHRDGHPLQHLCFTQHGKAVLQYAEAMQPLNFACRRRCVVLRCMNVVWLGPSDDATRMQCWCLTYEHDWASGLCHFGQLGVVVLYFVQQSKCGSERACVRCRASSRPQSTRTCRVIQMCLTGRRARGMSLWKTEHEQTPFLEYPFHKKIISFRIVHAKDALRHHTWFLNTFQSKISACHCVLLLCQGATLLCEDDVLYNHTVRCCNKRKACL